MINLIIETLIVSVSSWILTRKYFGTKSTSDSILIWFTFFFAQIVLVELVLGALGKLFFWNIFLFHLVIFLSVLPLYFNMKNFLVSKPDIDFFINSNLLILAFSVFSAFFLVKVYLNLINPPTCPDSLQYHLSFPATWILNGNLDNPFVIFQGIFSPDRPRLEITNLSYFPINAELFFLWLMIPLRNAFFADLGQAPFYIIGIIAIFSILRKYGIDRKISLLGGFLWVLIPNILKQIKYGSQIDVICAVMFLLVLNSLLLIKSKFTLRNSILFGITVGLFVGTKVLNIIWLISLMPLIACLLYKGIKTSRVKLSNIFILLVSFVLMAILFGGFMYIKNFILTGNPVFPMEVKIFGKEVFRGLLDSAQFNRFYSSGDKFDLGRFAFREGLGVQFSALILPCILLPVILFSYLKKKLSLSRECLLLFITPLIMFAFYFIFAKAWLVRYLFPFLTMGLVSALVFIPQLPKGKKYISFIAFVSILSSASELAHRYELIVSILFALLFFVLLLIYRKKILIFYKSNGFRKAILLILILVLVALFYLNYKYDKEEFYRYTFTYSRRESWQADIGKGWEWLNKQSKEGTRIAYTGRQEFYPLFGSKLKNQVKYISINEKEALPYNKPDGLCRDVKHFQAWRENLKNEKIKYLYIALPPYRNREFDDPAKFTTEDEWASAYPEGFRLLFNNSLTRIYEVLNDDSKQKPDK